MILRNTVNVISFTWKILPINILLISVGLSNLYQIDAVSCSLSSGKTGNCVKLKDCRSAITLARKGVNLEFCNYEGGVVCCNQNGREIKDVTTVERRQSTTTKLPPIEFQKYLYDQKDSNLNSQEVPGRRKHSVDKSVSNNANGKNHEKRKNNRNSENSEERDTQDKTLYYDFHSELGDAKRQPFHRPHGSNKQFDDYFVPPGLEKKKPWRDEKTTENQFYYEYVTKKPLRGPGRKGTDKPKFNDNFDGNNQSEWVLEVTTKRNEWYNQGGRRTTTNRYEWYDTQNEYSSQRPTTKRIKWNQETTTRRHYESANEQNSKKPPRRPQPFSEGPTYQQPSPPQDISQNQKPNRFRISQLKCQEYSNEVTENITGLPLTTNPDPVVIPVRKCIQAQQLIVGGENSTLGEFPHMAAIGFRDRSKKGIVWNCGGSLISELYVMTAAHCTATSSGPPVKVRLGEYNLVKNDDGAYPVDYGIIKIIVHPQYRPPSKYNDIALLKLSRIVTFYKHIRPACLHTVDTLSSSKAIATGWGRLFYDGSVSEVLQKVVLSIVDSNTCNRLYKANKRTEVLSRGIIESQLCAGELSGGKDTCQGDSGGPLSITSSQCIHHIIGITSFGKSCALPNSTGVYTRVSAFVSWIESVVWPTN